MRWLRPLGGLGLLVSLMLSAQTGRAQAPVVVEFFTSQGCSSCPPADEIFAQLARQPGVIALALHVDYWDYLGWKDAFGKPEHSERQRRYAKAHGERTIYTPQMVVQGLDLLLGHEEPAVRSRIAAHAQNEARVRIELHRAGRVLEIALEPSGEPVGVADVHVVHFLPEQTMTVEAGENAGYRHTFTNVVTEWATVARWDGQGAMTIRHEDTAGDAIAVIVQVPQNGRILSAARLP